MTIDSVVAGETIDPDWGNAVADQLNGLPLLIQTGSVSVASDAGTVSSQAFSFAEDFDAAPILVCNLVSSGDQYVVTAGTTTASGSTLYVFRTDGGAIASSRTVNYIAIGTPAS